MAHVIFLWKLTKNYYSHLEDQETYLTKKLTHLLSVFSGRVLLFSQRGSLFNTGHAHIFFKDSSFTHTLNCTCVTYRYITFATAAHEM